MHLLLVLLWESANPFQTLLNNSGLLDMLHSLLC
jgi:hypothetical protein